MRLCKFAGSGHNASPINGPPGIWPAVAVRLTMSGWVLFGSGTLAGLEIDDVIVAIVPALVLRFRTVATGRVVSAGWQGLSSKGNDEKKFPQCCGWPSCTVQCRESQPHGP